MAGKRPGSLFNIKNIFVIEHYAHRTAGRRNVSQKPITTGQALRNFGRGIFVFLVAGGGVHLFFT